MIGDAGSSGEELGELMVPGAVSGTGSEGVVKN